MQWLNHDIRDAFRAQFCDRFAHCPDFPLWEFRSYLAEFLRLREAEAASCEDVITECEDCDALKQVGLNKSPGLDGLPYKVYLRLQHIFVPILTDVLNQGVIPGSIAKKGDRHVWQGLDDYKPITLLNTELKILVRVLANRLQLVISDLIGPEQTYAMKGRSIQDNLHFVREVLEEIKDGTEAALVNLDQFKAFESVDHRFLASVLETTEFKPEFCRWISIMYLNPRAVVQMSGSVRDQAIGPAGLLPGSEGLGMSGHIRSSAVFLLLALLQQRYPRSPIILPSLYSTAWT